MRIGLIAIAVASLAVAALAQQAPPTPTPQEPTLKVGDPAPEFSLEASDGKTYKLSDFKGKKAVVVAWFPKAYTRAARSSANRSRQTARRSGSSTSPTSWPAWIPSMTTKGSPRRKGPTSRC